jgi:hypothetical protein
LGRPRSRLLFRERRTAPQERDVTAVHPVAEKDKRCAPSPLRLSTHCSQPPSCTGCDTSGRHGKRLVTPRTPRRWTPTPMCTRARSETLRWRSIVRSPHRSQRLRYGTPLSDPSRPGRQGVWEGRISDFWVGDGDPSALPCDDRWGRTLYSRGDLASCAAADNAKTMDPLAARPASPMGGRLPLRRCCCLESLVVSLVVKVLSCLGREPYRRGSQAPHLGFVSGGGGI